MSIAVELIAQLESIAAENGVDKIQEFTIEAGVFRGIVPEALDLAFEEISKGTCAEGAKMTLKVISALAKCNQCGLQFKPEIDSYLCEECELADVELLEGNDITLTLVSATN